MSCRLSIAGKLSATFMVAALIVLTPLFILVNQALKDLGGGTIFSLVSGEFIVYACLAMALGALCIYISVTRVVRHIRHLTRMTQKITAKKYNYRSRIKRADELGDLARALDRMARQLGRYQEQEKAYIEDLGRQTLQLKQLNEYLVYFEESERKSIASEIHGTIAQTLGLGVSRIKTLIASCEDETGCEELIEARAFLENGVKEVRTLMYELAPPILDDFDIDVAIEFLVEEINERNGAHFDFTNAIGGPISLNRAVKLTFYRAVKTIINNILEYAQDPPAARLELSAIDDRLYIRVDVTGLRLGLKQATVPAGDISGHQDFSKRMERLGGEIKVLPGPRSVNCSTIILTAPVLTAPAEEFGKDQA
ncbi:MAG: HAMP domain-containing protein [Desulfobacter sp.]|nr:MAG: HAMP domain-containing protein [Desulfobacter sp.]